MTSQLVSSSELPTTPGVHTAERLFTLDIHTHRHTQVTSQECVQRPRRRQEQSCHHNFNAIRVDDELRLWLQLTRKIQVGVLLCDWHHTQSWPRDSGTSLPYDPV